MPKRLFFPSPKRLEVVGEVFFCHLPKNQGLEKDLRNSWRYCNKNDREGRKFSVVHAKERCQI
jgi:hypothetical protein